ncbi:MAG: Mpo1-like protein [Elusimicrobiota bacterium]|nr:Mpo1-like protein [Elusimicrobiota bacterium]
MMKQLDYAALHAEYATFHRTRGNRRCHSVGIPLIVYAVTAWSRVGSPLPLAALLLPLYFRWDGRVGLLMTAFIGACAGLASVLPGWAAWAAFIVGWGFQLVGHEVYEKNRPALLGNLVHALVGPAFIAGELAGLRRR